MHPVLFTIPGINLSVPAYGFMMMLGFLTAILWAAHRAQRSGANPDVVLNCGFIALIGGVAGARAMYVVHYWEQFALRGSPGQIIWGILNVSEGGLEFYGGFIAATLGVVLYMVLWKHSLRWYVDITAPSAMLGLAFGRLGCFLNGCCWGGACTLPWAVAFPYASPPHFHQMVIEGEARASVPAELVYTLPDGRGVPIRREHLRLSEQTIDEVAAREAEVVEAIAKIERELATADPARKAALERQLDEARGALKQIGEQIGDVRTQMRKFGLTYPELQAKAAQHHSAPLHPTQLYDAFAALLLALLLDRFYWLRRRDGQVLCLLLMLQPLARFLVEVIRVDNPTDTLQWFTISQAIALGLLPAGIIGWLIIRNLPPRSPRAQIWVPPEEPKRAGAKA